MKSQTVLVLDDEPDIRDLLSMTLARMDIDCETAGDLAEAKNKLNDQDYFLCLADMRLPDGDGIQFVEYIQQHKPDLPVAVITAYGNVEGAVNTLKAGAFDYVSKPINLDMLRSLVNTALQMSQRQLYPESAEQQLLGDSSAILALRQTIKKLSRSQAPVFIGGESGVGKELVAKLIHEQGPRADNPFIPVNCGAIPSELLESEFFGHIKGSFTGAMKDKQGLFQAANGGTLFLDEIADLPLHMQVKLLRAIQEKAIRPIGASQEIAVDVRILSATHKDLLQLVNDSEFRQDLFYRINVIEIHVPALRERQQDISVIAQSILHRLAQQNGVVEYCISPAAIEALLQYDFPGNVRELENILERAATLCEGSTIDVTSLQLPNSKNLPNTQQTDNDSDLDSYLENQEKQQILTALEETKWNRTAAAKLLGISFRALRYRLKKFGIE